MPSMESQPDLEIPDRLYREQRGVGWLLQKFYELRLKSRCFPVVFYCAVLLGPQFSFRKATNRAEDGDSAVLELVANRRFRADQESLIFIAARSMACKWAEQAWIGMTPIPKLAEIILHIAS